MNIMYRTKKHFNVIHVKQWDILHIL